MGDLAVHAAAVEIAERYAIGREDRHIAIGQEEHVLGVGEDGGHVAGDEVLVVADADDDGGAVARGDDLVRTGARPRGRGQAAGAVLGCGAHGFFQVAFEMLLHEVGDDFGVGLGFEGVAFVLELLLEGQVVFDDAIVHHDDVAFTVAVRVGVFLGGAAVGGPARVADAEGAIDGVVADSFFEVAQLALGAANFEMPVIAVNGEARGIISPIFQALQAFQNNRNGAMGTNVTYNATHNLYIIRAATGSPGAGARQSTISTRYSSITGLARTSCAMVSMSVCACSRVVPLASAISKNLP